MSTLETLWSKLSGRQAQRQASIESRWTAAVAAIADGKAPAEATLDELFLATGRGVDDLRAAVDRLIARRQARARYDAAVKARGELPQITAALAASVNTADAEIQAALARKQKRDALLLERKAIAEANDQAGKAAEQYLLDTAASPTADAQAELDDLADKLVSAKVRRDAAHRAAHQASRQLGDLVPEHKRYAGTPGILSDAREHETRLAGEIAEQEKVEKAQAGIATAAAGEIRELEARIDAISRGTLDP